MILRNTKRMLLGVTLALAGCATALAIPAKPGILEYPMRDGSTVDVILHGDEHSSYYTTVDGYVLLPDSRGDLCYVTLRNGAPARSKVKATQAGRRPVSEIRFIEAIDKNEVLTAVRNADAETRAAARAKRREASAKGVELITSYPTIGSPDALVLLIEFSDVKFQTPDPLKSFDNLTNLPGYDHNGATGSALDYFRENSGGLFSPNFHIYGPITLDNNEAYYGTPEGLQYDRQAWKMVQEGCAKLRQMHPELDFSQFDNDGDGFVDNIAVYYAGYGQNEGAESWRIWPHAANLYTYYGVNDTYDGVKLGNYFCTNELKGTSGTVLTGIGTFCHEFSHILGLPDLYPTNGSGAFTPGTYELMDIGPYNNNCNTPPLMSAYDRMSVGWLKVRDLSGPETVTLRSIGHNEALRIPTAKDEEFFLLENRQQTGWDTYIEGHGMLVWHIDYNPSTWSSNSVNNNTSHQGVDIVEADGIPTSETRGGDPFPGNSHATSFTSTSIPSMKTWIGIDPDMPLTDIRETDGVITFKVKGGGERIDPITAVDATDITATSFTANWTGRPEIALYEVDLCRGLEVVPFRTVTVRSATSVSFDNLEPSTQYRYTVRAVDGDRKSGDSNEITLTTADPTFDMLRATALPATNVAGTEFTAAWESLDGADSYELSVYTKEIVDPTVYKADFTNVGGSILPEGWSTTATATDSRSGYFGDARPSLKMSNRAQLQTPVFNDDINYFSMWLRGNSTVEADRVEIDGLVDFAWQNLMIVNPISATAGTTAGIGPDFDVAMPVGVKSVRLRFYTDEATSLCVDDVKVGAGGRFNPVYFPGYAPRNVGLAISEHIEGLTPNTTYYYTVCGIDGDLRSLVSNEIAVTTGQATAIEEVGDDSGISFITVPEGLEVINHSGSEQTVECFAPSGSLLYQGNVHDGATLTVSLPLHSISIVKCGPAVTKVLR
ncbi:MAG: M6 family metalloprotease domain-containing protein [Clostridium sp.]|nr:M6 family metalloprotease domain-containing protein [Clostridium sp.]